MLWLATLGTGVGIAALYPCAVTIPEEASIPVTPAVQQLKGAPTIPVNSADSDPCFYHQAMMLGFNLVGTAGEMVGPVVLGWRFGHGHYAALGEWAFVLTLLSLCFCSVAYHYATYEPRKLP